MFGPCDDLRETLPFVGYHVLTFRIGVDPGCHLGVNALKRLDCRLFPKRGRLDNLLMSGRQRRADGIKVFGGLVEDRLSQSLYGGVGLCARSHSTKAVNLNLLPNLILAFVESRVGDARWFGPRGLRKFVRQGRRLPLRIGQIPER